MSAAAKRRRFRRWRRYRTRWETLAGSRVGLTKSMSRAWIAAARRVGGGQFQELPLWHYVQFDEPLEGSAHGGRAVLKTVPRRES